MKRKKAIYIFRELVILIPVFIYLFALKGDKWPLFIYMLFFVLMLFACGKSIFDYFQYKNGKANYVAISTINNEYSKFISFIMGAIFVIVSAINFFWFDDSILNIFLGFGLGIMSIFNGFFYLPNGAFKFKKGKIDFTGLEYDLQLEEVLEIQLYSTKIVLLLTDNELIHTFNFKLDLKSIQAIDEYVSSRAPQIDVKNCLESKSYEHHL